MKTCYIHIIIIFILFAHFKSSNGQSIPQMQLKTSEFKPSTFTPSQYKPIQSDPSILQRSFERQEQRANQANQALLDLEPVPQYLLTLGRSSVVQMCSRSEGAMRLHCDRNKRTQMHDDWPRQR